MSAGRAAVVGQRHGLQAVVVHPHAGIHGRTVSLLKQPARKAASCDCLRFCKSLSRSAKQITGKMSNSKNIERKRTPIASLLHKPKCRSRPPKARSKTYPAGCRSTVGVVESPLPVFPSRVSSGRGSRSALRVDRCVSRDQLALPVSAA
jgi:hypothetical protein